MAVGIPVEMEDRWTVEGDTTKELTAGGGNSGKVVVAILMGSSRRQGASRLASAEKEVEVDCVEVGCTEVSCAEVDYNWTRR